jgi:amphi-Trp domain-containing protein
MGSDKKSKVRSELSRDEAVQCLQSLVDQLRAGSATVGERAVTLAERVRLKMEAEADELEIKLKWDEKAVTPQAATVVRESY